ncbi:MAG: Fe-S cluster assembly protein SufD [Halobacteriovoraceae bacterium]|jgi:Fe-S cluster assembly protein SufD|nr:Fe-S cluster assembly protein SufD [Halobacteriovoraceae bacterium]MBT5094085.1 Fe-S cluster assembly protein SufD [Halobacteriovoraceae bacterium]
MLEDTKQKYTEKLGQRHKAMVGTSPLLAQWLEKGLSELKTQDFPAKKNDAWKYTKSSAFLPANYNLPTELSAPAEVTIAKELVPFKNRIVFLNGAYQENASFLPEGVSLQVLNNEARDWDVGPRPTANAFDSLNLASARELINIIISPKLATKEPIGIHHLWDLEGEAYYSPRVYINCQAQAEVTLVEVFASAATEAGRKYTTNASTIIEVAESAHLNHIKVQQESLAANHFGQVHALVKKHAHYNSFIATLGGHTSRSEVTVDLTDDGATTEVHGLYDLDGSQHADHFSTINHLFSRTYSQQVYKGLLRGEAHGVFTGKMLVARDAQQVDSAQLNKNLLLSKKAHIHTRPQLEVYADDVKCAHGATVGQLSQEEVFYLQSRGIPSDQAITLLCQGFVNDVVQKINNEEVRVYLEQLVSKEKV